MWMCRTGWRLHDGPRGCKCLFCFMCCFLCCIFSLNSLCARIYILIRLFVFVYFVHWLVIHLMCVPLWLWSDWGYSRHITLDFWCLHLDLFWCMFSLTLSFWFFFYIFLYYSSLSLSSFSIFFFLCISCIGWVVYVVAVFVCVCSLFLSLYLYLCCTCSMSG